LSVLACKKPPGVAADDAREAVDYRQAFDLRRSLQRDLRALIEKHLLVVEGATNRLVYRAAGKR
jgi:hypothetical protein